MLRIIQQENKEKWIHATAYTTHLYSKSEQYKLFFLQFSLQDFLLSVLEPKCKTDVIMSF